MGAAAAGALLLAGCNTPQGPASLQAGISDCLVNTPDYTQAWNCSRGLPGGTAFVTNGDAVQARVNNGEITDAQARSSLSGGFSDGAATRSSGGGRDGGGGGRR